MPDPPDSDEPRSGTAIAVCRDVSRIYTRGSEGMLSRWRDTSRPSVTALRDVSIKVEPGEIVGLAGPSGSGKSTLLHLLGGLDVPSDGTVEIDGTDTTNCSPRERTRLRLRAIGIVFQRFHLLPSLSARANVALPLVERGIKKRSRRRRATELLERVGLADRETHTPGELSGGEQQRVAIARALVGEPPLVLADEPTGELDTETGAEVMDALTAAAEDDQAVVVASHDQETLERADRIVQLRDGDRIDEAH